MSYFIRIKFSEICELGFPGQYGGQQGNQDVAIIIIKLSQFLKRNTINNKGITCVCLSHRLSSVKIEEEKVLEEGGRRKFRMDGQKGDW